MQEFQTQIDSLASEQKDLDEKKAALRKEAIARVESLIQLFGLTAEEIDFEGKPAAAPAAKRPVAPKYRNEQGLTWSGRGRKPAWVAAAEAAGNLQDYAV